MQSRNFLRVRHASRRERTRPVPRHRALPPPLPPELLKRDEKDFAVLGGIVNLPKGFERAGLISDVPVVEVAEWMERRVSNFCAMLP